MSDAHPGAEHAGGAEAGPKPTGPDEASPQDAHADGDHPGHDHAEGTHGTARMRGEPKAAPPRTRPGESGGAAIQLDLELVLSTDEDERGRFAKLVQVLEAKRGVLDVHLRRDTAPPEVCIHYDAALINVARLTALVRATGLEVTDRYPHATWLVRGMDCGQCGVVIEHSLARLPGVLSAHVAYAAERLVVDYDRRVVKASVIEARINALGFELEEPAKGHACSGDGHGGGLSPKLELPLAIISAVLVGVGFTIAKIAIVPPWASTASYLVAALAGGAFSGRAAALSVRQRVFDIETLMVIAAVGAIAMGAYFEGALLLALFSLGHALEHRAMERTRRAIEALAELRPESARVRRLDQIVETSVASVRKGDLVVVRPGDRLPIDGLIREGNSTIDEAAITGESIPVAKGPGDEVFAGTINKEAALEIEVTKISAESALARIVDMVSEAEAQKSPTQRFTQQLERRFVPLVLIAAPLLAAYHFLVNGSSAQVSLLVAMALLVSASPCALAISTPSAVLSAVARGARGGVMIKGGAHLETLGRVRAMAFDKTGTLTSGHPRLVEVAPVAGVDETMLLTISAGAEALSPHPIAIAILVAAKARGLNAPAARDLRAVHGKGMTATVDGQIVTIGNLAMFDGTVPSEIAMSVERMEAAGQTTMIVQRADQFLGVLGVADMLRPEAKETLVELRRLGIRRTVLLSGDNQRVATAIGAQVGVDEARGGLMPNDKVRALKELASEGGVAMVGDGVNDAPALAAASVGIALGGAGSDVALETADVVLMSHGVGRLPFAVGLARSATRVIRQNLAISLGVSAVLIVATIFNLTSIGQAIVFHEGATLIVIANALRLLAYR